MQQSTLSALRIEDLAIGVRAYTGLLQVFGLGHDEDGWNELDGIPATRLCSYTYSQLRVKNQIGIKTAEEIRLALAEYGLSLKSE